jgi:hypothetical protein
MALSIEINGVDRTEWLAVNSLRVSRPLGGRASGNAVLEDMGRGYTPTLDHEFVLKDGATKYFAGTIRSIDEFCHPPTFRKQFSLRLLDFNHICDRRRTRSVTYSGSPGVSLGDIVSHIVSTFLDGEGITTTNVATGPTIDEPVTFNYHSVTEAFDYLSRLTAKYGDPYLWYIDFDKNLYFSQFAANTAPFSLTNTSANFWDFKISRTLDNYRNIQHARTEYEIATSLTESFTGDGSTIWFVTTQLITDTPVVVVNGVPQTVGEFGVDHLSNTWYWIRNSPGVHITNQVPLTGSDTLVVTYQPLATNVVTVSDDSQIATYGKFEAIDEQKNVDDYQTLVAIATGGLAQFGTVPVRPTFKTRTAGLEPGQRLTINLTRHGINASYLIEDVSFRFVAAAQSFLEFDVRCTSTERAGAARTSWMENVVRMARVGRPPQTITGTSGSAAVRDYRLSYVDEDDEITVGADVGRTDGRIDVAATEYVELEEVGINVRIEPTGFDLIVDILVSTNEGASWTSIFPAGDSNKLVLPANEKIAATTNLSITTFNRNDIFRVDYVQVGAPVSGGGLLISMKGKVYSL